MRFLVRHLAIGALVAAAPSRGPAQNATVPDPRLPLHRLPITARVDLPTSADWIAFGFGSVWVVNYRPSRVSRIDTATNRVTSEIALGPFACLQLVIALDHVWVPTCQDGVINEIDPANNSIIRRIPAPIKGGREGAIAFSHGSLWIPDNASDSSSSSVVRLNARSGAIEAKLATGARSDVVVAGFGSIWVSSSAENVIVRIDPTTNQVIARITVGSSPKFMTAGDDALWVQNRYDGSVSKVDPITNQELVRVDAWAPTQAGDIAAGAGAVWLSVNGMPVTRIDQRTSRVTHQFVGGDGADAIRWGADALWVADHKIGQLWRIDHRRIVLR